ncbi:YhhN-like protein [Aspergillus spectabilis]
MLPPLGPQILLLSLPLLVLSEYKSRSHTGTVLFKMLSSFSFLIGPVLTVSTERSTSNIAITTGLLFSLLGDYLLLPSRDTFYNHPPPNKDQEAEISVSFKTGIFAFAIAHIAYITAFLQYTETETILYTTLTTTFLVTMTLAKWLGVIYPPPTANSSTANNILNLSIPVEMKPLVLGYAMIISAMFGTAIATSTSPSGMWIPQHALGAALFVISDVFVAKDAFGQGFVATDRGWVRIGVAYGLYFWGQMVIAGTVG